jgi:ABC-2 type transport system permease protein
VTAAIAQTLMEIRRVYRNRRYLLFTVLLPVTFELFFVALFDDNEMPGVGRARSYLLVGTTAYGVMAATLITFAGRIAMERERGWFSLLRTTPVTMSVVLGAKVVASLVASALVVVVMLLLGMVLNGAGFLPAASWIALGVALVLGALPFTALALFIGYVFDADSAWSASLWLYFALAMIGGLFTPVEMMPTPLQAIGVLTPAYRYGKIGWTIATGGTDIAPHVAWLIGYLVAFSVLAVVAYRRHEAREYS